MEHRDLRRKQNRLHKMRRALFQSLWADVCYHDGHASVRTRRIAARTIQKREQLATETYEPEVLSQAA